MKGHKILLISSLIGLSLLAAAPAFAQGPEGRGEGWGPQQGPRGAMQIMMQRFERRPMPMEMFGGKVTAVSSPNFTLELPAFGRQATTTVTVATNASTTFMLGKQSASIADVAVGDFATVQGRYATSTQTLTALRVNLATSTPSRGMQVRGLVHDAISERLNEEFSSSMPPRNFGGMLRGIMQSLLGFFHR